MLTTQKVATGEFKVIWNGADTGRRIVNGSAGLSGRDTQNVYGIVVPGNPPKWIGTLAACKKILAFTMKGKAK